ncbi:MAG TPA: AAA family ATPase, partial [Actinomycetota bacterium]
WVLAGDGHEPEQGEADFVIAHPLDGVLAIEAKGGDLRYDPATRRWSQGGRAGRHDLKADPFHQARGEMHSLVRILEARRGWDEWRPSYGYAVAFPDGRYDRDAHPGAPASLAIDRDDMDRLDERVREIMGTWRRDGRRFGERGMAELDHALGFRVEIRTPLGIAFDEEEKRILELTQEQSYLRSYVLHRKRAVVSGPPGSGKTVLAVGIAEHLAAEGKRTLFTCFNTKLAEYLRGCVAGTEGVTVAHFHGLAVALADEAGIALVPPRPDDPEAERAHYEERLPEALEEAARRLGPRFDAIVVDEAQDFRDWWWPALLATHVDPDDGVLYLFADDSQRLYAGGGSWPCAPDDVLPPLPHNLRNTERIHGFVSVFFDAGGGSGAAKGPRGRDVEVLDYGDDEQLFRLLELVLANLEQEEVAPEDVVVLTPTGRGKSKLWARRRFGRFELVAEPVPGKVLWSSVHAFKGLERSVVILAELGDRHEEDVDRYVRVGASRATHHLIVLATLPVAREIRRRASDVIASPAPHAPGA